MFDIFAARKSKSDVFAEKLDKINSENRTMKTVLVTAISKMTDLMIHNMPKLALEQDQVSSATPGEQEEAPRKVHKCTYNCTPYCCKIYDD